MVSGACVLIPKTLNKLKKVIIINVQTVQVASCAGVLMPKTLNKFKKVMIIKVQTVQVASWPLLVLLKTFDEFINCVFDMCCILQCTSEAR